RVGLRPVQRVLVRCPGRPDRSDASDRTGPGERLADDEVTVADRKGVLSRHARVLEDDVAILVQPLPHLVDDRLVADAGRATRHEDAGETLPAALRPIGANDDRIDVGALHIPAGRARRPVLPAVDDVLAVLEVGGYLDAGLRIRMVEVRSAARRAGRLGDDPPG